MATFMADDLHQPDQHLYLSLEPRGRFGALAGGAESPSLHRGAESGHVTCWPRDPDTLKGLVAAAEALDMRVDDPETFLREQQEAVFAWAAGSSSTSSDAPPT